MIIQRKKYLDMLISGEGNNLVKIVTGVRRCGKSFLLFKLFRNYLTEKGVDEQHIIELSLDDLRNKKLRNPETLLKYIDSHLLNDKKTTYIILDEVQLVQDFVEVLLSLLHTPFVDVYVSGSNSKFLSKDVVTEFRGRGDEIRVYPLSFSEFYSAVGGDKSEVWKEYYTYGGLPQILEFDSEKKKSDYLKNLYELTYMKDVQERNHLRNADGLFKVVQMLASCIGSPTNPKRISDTFKTVEKKAVTDKTILNYIECLKDAFLIEEALRYDVKGRKYIGTETKYYFEDIGLRNAILNFRQQEEPHIMENIIYNELKYRGFNVDVGFVETWENKSSGKSFRHGLEVDFVVNKGAERIYIQSVFKLPTDEKKEQEERPLLNINDSFKKIIITGENIKRKTDEKGILTIGLLDFLLDEKCI
ncbi:MAG: ATP-binding protein [Treponema sp.]|nr:ATP-binding protein [Spirochaetia bacterium]MDD7534558.1 ATP-binding protein [Treponema sp.]MDY5757075.1 ATP-binding protein [Treponema sp.]MDY5816639.1 ATP-binding protein [Treponema sp.]